MKIARSLPMRAMLAVASGLAVCASLAAASPASAATRPGAVPQIQEGKICKTVSSSGNWHGTICAIVNFDDAKGDIPTQALISFSVNSGGIHEAYAVGGLYLDVNGSTENYRQSPSTYPGGAKSTQLSTAWNYNQVGQWQAVVNTPCIKWTNGQKACYNGVLRSGWTRGF
jgi:hypothetical protein